MCAQLVNVLPISILPPHAITQPVLLSHVTSGVLHVMNILKSPVNVVELVSKLDVQS